jgi:hypothetical protein
MVDFFDKKNCDRCDGDLQVRTMSWFTEETICMKCSDAESKIKEALLDAGKSDMECCGYVPKLEDVAT